MSLLVLLVLIEEIIIVVGEGAVGKRAIGKGEAVNANYSEGVYSRGGIAGRSALAPFITLLVS